MRIDPTLSSIDYEDEAGRRLLEVTFDRDRNDVVYNVTVCDGPEDKWETIEVSAEVYRTLLMTAKASALDSLAVILDNIDLKLVANWLHEKAANNE